MQEEEYENLYKDSVMKVYEIMESDVLNLNDFMHRHLEIDHNTPKTFQFEFPIKENSEAGLFSLITIHNEDPLKERIIAIEFISQEDQFEDILNKITESDISYDDIEIYIFISFEPKKRIPNIHFSQIPSKEFINFQGIHFLEEFYRSIEGARLIIEFGDETKKTFSIDSDTPEEIGEITTGENIRLNERFIEELTTSALDAFSQKQKPRVNQVVKEFIQEELDVPRDLRIDAKEVTRIQFEASVDVQFQIAPIQLVKTVDSFKCLYLRKGEFIDPTDNIREESPQYKEWRQEKGDLILHMGVSASKELEVEHVKTENKFTVLPSLLNDTEQFLSRVVPMQRYVPISSTLNNLRTSIEILSGIVDNLNIVEDKLAKYIPERNKDIFLPEVQEDFKKYYLTYYNNFYSALGTLFRFIKVANMPLKGMVFPNRSNGMKGKLKLLKNTEFQIKQEDLDCVEASRKFRSEVISHPEDISKETILTWFTFNLNGKLYISCTQAKDSPQLKINNDIVSMIASSEDYLLEEIMDEVPENTIFTAPPIKLSMLAFTNITKAVLKHACVKQRSILENESIEAKGNEDL